jgi:hypothetical protein
MATGKHNFIFVKTTFENIEGMFNGQKTRFSRASAPLI